jgi:carboxypeptidase family protein
MAAIVAVEPRFAGIGRQDPDLIGQSAWYQARPASGVGAFVVMIQMGWGDCPSGCIEKHTWTYAVAPDGTVTLLTEGGDPIPDDLLPGPSADGGTGITGRATAGPVCPVEQPGDAACAPRPVAGAEIVVTDASGAEVGTVTTLPDGSFAVELPAGDYTVQARLVDGMMGAPAPLTVTVRAGALSHIDLEYDTGLR